MAAYSNPFLDDQHTFKPNYFCWYHIGLKAEVQLLRNIPEADILLMSSLWSRRKNVYPSFQALYWPFISDLLINRYLWYASFLLEEPHSGPFITVNNVIKNFAMIKHFKMNGEKKWPRLSPLPAHVPSTERHSRCPGMTVWSAAGLESCEGRRPCTCHSNCPRFWEANSTPRHNAFHAHILQPHHCLTCTHIPIDMLTYAYVHACVRVDVCTETLWS